MEKYIKDFSEKVIALIRNLPHEEIAKAIDKMENSEELKTYLAQKIGAGEIERKMLY